MSNASKLLNAIWDEKNLVRQDDSTPEIVRKHKLFKAITDAISNDELQRGRDYGGTEEDSIYNGLSECAEILFERSIMKHDSAARDYLGEVNAVDCTWWIVQQLSKAEKAYELLQNVKSSEYEETIRAVKALLKSLVPDEYPSHEDNE